MKFKKVFMCASLALSSFFSFSAQAFEINNPEFWDLAFSKRDHVISEREKTIKDILEGNNKQFPTDNIGKLEWMKNFSDPDIGLPGKGYVIKVIDNESKEPRYFGASTSEIWLTPKNIQDFNFAVSGFNFDVHNTNPLPIKDSNTIKYISNMKDINVTLIHPTYVPYNELFEAIIYPDVIKSEFKLDKRFLIKKEDFLDSNIITVNGISFYAKEMYLGIDGILFFKENKIHSGITNYDDFITNNKIKVEK